MPESLASAEERTGGDGTLAPGPRGKPELAETGLDEYVRDTVRNLAQFALRSGMPKARLGELIKEGLN
jgi:hypothetical protein